MKLLRREITGKLCDNVNQISLVERVLTMRGINHKDELDLGLKKLLPISALKGIQEATDLLIKAIVNQQSILIIGDFDADGATSTALAVRA